MARYYAAIDWDEKEIIKPPKGYSYKFPGIINPYNPFSNMVMMMNALGCNFVIENDDNPERFYSKKLNDVTGDVYRKFVSYFPWALEYYEQE